MTHKVAVVGGGVAGLVCARTLKDRGLHPVVFDMGRAVGGRISTRRGDGGLTWDHGAQHFSASDPRFAALVEGWKAAGVVDEWKGRVGTARVEEGKGAYEASAPKERLVGRPGMSAISKALAEGLEVRTGMRVERMAREGAGWSLVCAPQAPAATGGAPAEPVTVAGFDAVVVAVHVGAARRLLAESGVTDLAARLEGQASEQSASWVLMAAFEGALALPFDGAVVEGDPVASWLARDSSKPGRAAGRETWVLQSTAAFAKENMGAAKDAMVAPLLEALRRVAASFGVQVPEPAAAAAHRWGAAFPLRCLELAKDEACLFDAVARVAAAGDYCHSARVEGAALSGLAAAERLLRHLAPPPA
eukprot:tig00021434_g21301.t1